MGRAFSLKGFVDLPEPMHVDDVIAAEGGIGDQFAFPVAVGLLKTKEVGLGATNSLLERNRPFKNGKLRDFKRQDLVGNSALHALYQRSSQLPLTHEAILKTRPSFRRQRVVVFLDVRSCDRSRPSRR